MEAQNCIAGNSRRLERIVRSALVEIDGHDPLSISTPAFEDEVRRVTRLYLTIWANEADRSEG